MKTIMGKQDKIRGAHVRALLIYRSIQRIKSDALKRTSKETSDLFDKLVKEKGLDQETLEVLQNVYLHKKSETMEDRIYQAFESFKSVLEANKNDGVSTLLLTLSAEGDLYRKPKEKYCYPLKKTGLRISIIRLLIGEKSSVPGKDIAKTIGTSYNSTTFTINKINAIARRSLALPKGKTNDLIISRDRGGYRLNPLYPVTQEEL